MKAPKAETEYEERGRDCADAIRDGILRLVNEARAAGWRVDDVGEALITLGDALVRIDGLKRLMDLSRE